MTIRRAALLAAIGAILVILEQAIDAGVPLSRSTAFPLDLILGLVFAAFIPGLAWLAFFGSIYRERAGFVTPLSSRTAAWIALALGVVLPLFYVIPQALSYISVTRYGEARLLLSFTTQGAWMVFLSVYALYPDDRRIPKIAQGLALLAGLEFADVIYRIAFYTHFETWWNYHLGRTLWQIVTIAIRIFAAGSRLLFVWTVWRNQSPSEART
jgi:hypothetical protein